MTTQATIPLINKLTIITRILPMNQLTKEIERKNMVDKGGYRLKKYDNTI